LEDLALEFIDVSKSFPGVEALKKVNISIQKGTIHAIVGENGAGKSTLMKIAVGELKKDSGTMKIFGKEVNLNSASDGHRYGISLIHQEFSLVPSMSIAENIFLGREPTKGILKFIDKEKILKETEVVMDTLKMSFLPANRKVRDLTVAQRQIVEIAKALSMNSRIIIMDEPTAALTLDETERLFKTIIDLKEQGVTVIFISHRIEEIFEIADNVSVLRDGKSIMTKPIRDTNRDEIVKGMVGRSIELVFPKRDTKREMSSTVLEVRNLTKERQFYEISFKLKRGEILGIAGLVGAGRSEVAMSIFGLNPPDAGEILIDGKTVRINSPFEAIKHGIALLPEDRRELGLIIVRDILENMTLSNLYWDIAKGFFINKNKELKAAEDMKKELSIKASSLKQRVEFLSGGNQQKVVVGKWLMTNPKILIMDEPTRGIDVGAKSEIYNIVRELSNKGISIIFISSELSEVIGVSDRILVMSEGRVVAELSPEGTTEEDILKLAVRKKVS